MAFTLSFHLVMSDFLLEKEQEKYHESAGKSYEKSDCLSHRVRCRLQKRHAWLLSPLLPTVAKAQ